MAICVGDNVILKPNPADELWQVIEVNPSIPVYVKIKGLTNRLIKVAPEDEIEIVNEITANKILENSNLKTTLCLASISQKNRPEETILTSGENVISKIPGTVLHLDSDENFLNKCLDYYKGKTITAHGYTMKPSEMPGRILELLNTHNPSILVITGHDGCTNKKEPYSLGSYLNSRYYIESVKQARKFDRNKDNLVIFAGACESFYEGLMESGANFASSPKKISIHMYDPAVIASEVALTPILSRVNPAEVIAKSESSFDEIGGIDTMGALRNGIPFNMVALRNIIPSSINPNMTRGNSYDYTAYFPTCPMYAYGFLCFVNRNNCYR